VTSRLVPFLLLGLLLLSCTSAPVRGGSGVAVSGERVLVASAKGKVFALDISARSKGLPFPAPGEWAFPDKGSSGAIYATPLVQGDTVYVATYQGQLLALDGATGKARSSNALFNGGAVVGAPAPVGGTLYLSSGSSVYALDPVTGQALWPKPFQAADRIWGSPVVQNETVYVGSLDHNVYALKAQDGSLLWQYTAGGAIASTLTPGDGALFFSAFDGVYALEADTGALRWHFASKVWFWATPLLSEGKLFVGARDGILYAFDATSGQPVWERTPGGQIYYSPALGDGVLVIGSSGAPFNLYGVDPEKGDTLWTKPLGAAPAGDVAVANGVAYVQAKDLTVFAFRAKGGELLWQFSLDR
jgi:outer membrane protein assembly factor BamB